MPYRLVLIDDQDGRPVGGGVFDTLEQAGLAAVTSQKAMQARGAELWPSVVYVDEDGRAHPLDQDGNEAFKRGMNAGMEELMGLDR